MVIVYDSRTGNVERFIRKLQAYKPGLFCIPIEDYNHELGPYHLITHTTNFGQIPEKTANFLYRCEDSDLNFVNLQSISSSGNKNWGKNFGVAADSIYNTSLLYKKEGVPIFLKFELSGTVQDVKTYLKKLKTYGKQMDSSQ